VTLRRQHRNHAFLPMKTAMATFRNREHAIRTGQAEDA